MNTSSIHRWLADGFIAGEQVTPGATWQIRITDELRARIVQQAPPEYLPMLETTMKLGVSRQTVFTRVRESPVAGMGLAVALDLHFCLCRVTALAEAKLPGFLLTRRTRNVPDATCACDARTRHLRCRKELDAEHQ